MSDLIKLRGFRNLGNTCYMNSALQALFASNIFNNSLLLYVKKNPECIMSFSPLLVEYCKILADLVDTKNSKLNDQSSVFSPSEFKETLGRFLPMFEGYSQHDSHELIISMITEFVENTKNINVVNLIKRLCYGRYKQYVCCDECRYVSESYTSFFDVQLPIPNTKNPDLEECFKILAQYETMDGDNKWNCPKCKKKVVAMRKMEINEVPEVAVFMFNRFIGSRKMNTPVKLYQFIELEEKKMRLVSTVNHYGSVRSGHYVSHVIRNVNGKDMWFNANDSTISPASDMGFLNDSSVYIAIYQVVPQ